MRGTDASTGEPALRRVDLARSHAREKSPATCEGSRGLRGDRLHQIRGH